MNQADKLSKGNPLNKAEVKDQMEKIINMEVQ
jgi:hypothetical protein